MPDLDRLRERYRSLSDQALLEAHAKGESDYIAAAWDVITSEVASRGLRPAMPGAGARASRPGPVDLSPGMQALLEYGRTPVNVVLPTNPFAGLPGARRELTDEEPDPATRELRYGAPAETVSPVGNTTAAPWALDPVLEARRERAVRVGKGRIVWGAIVLALGLLVTVGTYVSAEGSGGTYVFAWGAIVYGIFQMVRGRIASETGTQDA